MNVVNLSESISACVLLARIRARGDNPDIAALELASLSSQDSNVGQASKEKNKSSPVGDPATSDQSALKLRMDGDPRWQRANVANDNR